MTVYKSRRDERSQPVVKRGTSATTGLRFAFQTSPGRGERRVHRKLQPTLAPSQRLWCAGRGGFHCQGMVRAFHSVPYPATFLPCLRHPHRSGFASHFSRSELPDSNSTGQHEIHPHISRPPLSMGHFAAASLPLRSDEWMPLLPAMLSVLYRCRDSERGAARIVAGHLPYLPLQPVGRSGLRSTSRVGRICGEAPRSRL